ncbi:MAG: Rieske 2Fe-2S domain-containing protein [Streptosporangiales bacterium]|nr:Rieske 2Fe-2S domain-containing protein [Streptosporangiales bacterium]
MPVRELDAVGEEALYQQLRRFWHPVLFADELGTAPARVTLLDEAVVVVRMAAGVAAFRDLCVHRGTALSLGKVVDDELVCPYHGWTYDAGGVCTRIPARHGDNIPRRARLVRHQAREAPA